MGLETYEKYEAWLKEINSPEFIAEMKRLNTHLGWQYKAGVNPGKPGGHIVTRWACPPECPPCQEQAKNKKRYPGIF